MPINAIQSVFRAILETTWQASVLAILILLIQRTLPRSVSPRWRCAIWGLLLVRLAMPTLPASKLSLFNLQPRSIASPRIVMPDRVVILKLGETPTPATELAPKAPTAPASISTQWSSILACVWLAGVVVLIGRYITISIQLSRELRRRTPIDDPILNRELIACCDEIGIHRRPRMIETGQVHSPALCGMFRPVLLLPIGLIRSLDARERRFVLLHELVHLKSHDVLIGTIAWLFNAIHWFNPLLWYAAARFRADRELACDARVLQITDPAAATEYGQTILKLLESAIAPPLRLPGAAAMLGSQSSIHRRIIEISNPRRSARGWSIIAILLMIGIACVTLTRAAEVPQAPATRESLVTNVFDIRDLLTDRDFGDPKFDEQGWPISGAPIFSRPTTGQRVIASSGQPTTSPSRQQLVGSLIRQIQTAVDPTGWRDDDPAGPNIREVAGQFIIRQTQANLEAIRKMLEATREEMSRQITIEARFLTGDRLIEAWEPNAAQIWKELGDGVQVWPEFLDDFQVSLLLRATQARQDTTTLTAPRLTLFDKQRAQIVVETDAAYIADFKTTADGKLDPVTKTVHSGVMLDVRAEIRPDKESTTLVLHPQLSRLLRLEPAPWPAPPAARLANIQIPHMVITQFDKTFDVASGKALLLRTQPKLSPPDPNAPAEKPVYILVKPTIIIQREVQGNLPVPVLPER